MSEATTESAAAKASAPVVARTSFPAWLPAALLVLVTAALYWPVTRNGFVNYDDDDYVSANVHVQAGLTPDGLKWALTSPVSCNWHPLTMLSHMLDCQLYGVNPWGHHLTSLLLHALNTALVFLLLQQLTGAMWRSLFVAAMFGWHPVHVESVAWVAERKDVLSTFFGLLTLIAYVRYVRKREKISLEDGSRRREEADSSGEPSRSHTPRHLGGYQGAYWLALVFYACGLLSKPMLVTWPFVLLLLDYWPLGRWPKLNIEHPTSNAEHREVGERGTEAVRLSTINYKQSTIPQLLLEKIPFLALAVVASVVTLAVQKHAGAMATFQRLPLGARGENALISYWRYLGKLFWPAKLAIFYPYHGYWPLAEVWVAGAMLLGVSALFYAQRQRYPFLLMGWLWFIGTLVPVIGLVQVGEQAMADRYMYIPSLGVLLVVTWGLSELTRHWRYQALVLSLAGSAAVVLCLAMTRQQILYWQDSGTLFRHALAVTENNYLAYYNLGCFLDEQGHTDEAISQFQKAIRHNPGYAEAHYNLGNALKKKGRMDDAISEFETAIRLKPNFAPPYNNLGNALYGQGRVDEAISQFQEALRLEPDNAETHNNLGDALYSESRVDEAISQYQEAIRLKPDYALAQNGLGTALYTKGLYDDAISHFREAIRLNPDYAYAHISLGLALGKEGRTDEAIGEYQEAIRLKPDFADPHNYLGIALARKHQLDDAISQFQEALRLQPDYAAARRNLAHALETKNAPASQ